VGRRTLVERTSYDRPFGCASMAAVSELLGDVPGFDRLLGFRVTAASGDEVRGELEVGPHLHQPFGVVHGGAYCTVVETTASIGATLWLGDRGEAMGVTNTTHFLRVVRDGVLDVVATPVQRGRSQQLWSVTVHDRRDRLVAKGDVRLVNVPSTAAVGHDPAGEAAS
jgi:1,4-dihydroxy-2-naphthoyl-CoA hydrolase